MKVTIYINYQKFTIENKLIVWRMIDEVFKMKPFSFVLNSGGSLFNKILKFDFETNLDVFPHHKEFIYKMVKKGKELRQLVSQPVRIKIVREKEPEKKQITIDNIQKLVAGYFNVPMELMQSNTRKREVVQARQIAMKFSKVMTKQSLTTIGTQIGDKDHATVMHACKTVDNLIETNRQYRQQYEDIEKKLKQA